MYFHEKMSCLGFLRGESTVKKMGKKIEEMTPLNQLMELLGERKNDLLNLIKNKEHALKKAPEGSVRIVRCGKSLQFYKKSGPGDYQGKYMPREEDALARRRH